MIAAYNIFRVLFSNIFLTAGEDQVALVVVEGVEGELHGLAHDGDVASHFVVHPLVPEDLQCSHLGHHCCTIIYVANFCEFLCFLFKYLYLKNGCLYKLQNLIQNLWLVESHQIMNNDIRGPNMLQNMYNINNIRKYS